MNQTGSLHRFLLFQFSSRMYQWTTSTINNALLGIYGSRWCFLLPQISNETTVWEPRAWERREERETWYNGTQVLGLYSSHRTMHRVDFHKTHDKKENSKCRNMYYVMHTMWSKRHGSEVWETAPLLVSCPEWKRVMLLSWRRIVISSAERLETDGDKVKK